jgi:hypothetical protein
MCCEPSHTGPPPGWHDDSGSETRWPLADHENDAGQLPGDPRVGPAALTALAAIIQPAPGHRPGPRPCSTEGGQGRAIPSHGEDVTDLAADWPDRGELLPESGNEPAWAMRPRR